jgi:hypothetical protein
MREAESMKQQVLRMDRRDKKADPMSLYNAGKFFSPKTSERIACVSAQNRNYQ